VGKKLEQRRREWVVFDLTTFYLTGHHIGKEIVQLCEVITENGIAMPDGRVIIKFGDLFNIYNYISDKVRTLDPI
jgi:hypothetical protein